MSLFVLNSGVRDDVVCNLKWQGAINAPELGISVFEVPMQPVKVNRWSRVVVCDIAAQSVIQSARCQRAEFVLVYRRERAKNLSKPPLMSFRTIETVTNTAWQRAQWSRARRIARS